MFSRSFFPTKIISATLMALSLWVPTKSFAKDFETVPFVDLGRYAGKWYEIAKLPNKFQKKCAAETTAEYSLLENGRVKVVNSCLKENGELETITGEAKVKNKETNAELRVAFFKIFGKWIFVGKYDVIGLDPNYQWAVIGTPNLKYGWILSRTTTLDAASMGQIQFILNDHGYDSCAFVKTEHQDATGGGASLCP